MADIQQQIRAARAEGYSDDEIAKHLSQSSEYGAKMKMALDEGYKPSEILDHLAPAAAAPAPVSEIPAQRKLTPAQEIYQTVRPYAGPLIEAGGAIYGGIQGAGAGSLGTPTLIVNPISGAMLGSGLGYGIAKEGLEMADVAMGLKQPRQGTEVITAPLKNVAEGAAFELGGQALGNLVAKGLIAPTVNYLRRVSDPKAAALIAASEGKGGDIVNALRNYDKYVEQGMPTAGVAATPANATRYAALQADVAGYMPSEYLARQEMNVGARREALGKIAQDEKALTAAEKARTAASKPLYEQAEQGIADVTPVVPVLDKLIADNPGNRQLIRELKQIRNDLIADQTTGALRTDAKQVISVIDGIKARLAKEDNKFIKGRLADVRELLVDAVPGYRRAQEVHAEMSKPINIMQVGQYLEGKLTPALETPAAERASVFAGAVQNAPTTIKRSTGQDRFKQLTSILDPDQVKVVEGIQKDLARESQFELQAREGAKAGKAIPAAELGKSPAFFSKIATLANTISTKLQGKIDKKVAIELATEMLDPKLAANAMEKAMERQARGERLIRSLTELPVKAGAPKVVLMGATNKLAPENRNNLRAP